MIWFILLLGQRGHASQIQQVQLERLRPENTPAISPMNKFKILSKLHH